MIVYVSSRRDARKRMEVLAWPPLAASCAHAAERNVLVHSNGVHRRGMRDEEQCARKRRRTRSRATSGVDRPGNVGREGTKEKEREREREKPSAFNITP